MCMRGITVSATVIVRTNKKSIGEALYNLHNKEFEQIELYKVDGDYTIITDATITIYAENILINHGKSCSIIMLNAIVEWVLW